MAMCSTAHSASALKLEQIVGVSIFGMTIVDIVGGHVGDFHHLVVFNDLSISSA